GGRPARLRSGAALRHRGTGRHAEADHRQAQRGLAQCRHDRRIQAEDCRRWHRATRLDARGICGLYRQGRDQVVRHREEVRRQRTMNGTMNVWLRVAAVAAAILSGIATAKAADYPTHPITLVVPYAGGGGNDVIARIVAEKMSASLGQTVVIENRSGAGGTIATRQVAKAEPDG